MTIGVIDIGTNTVLLLVAQLAADGTITPLIYEQRVPRLGKGVDSAKRLQTGSMERVIDVLLQYKKLLDRFDTAAIIVCGTSAVRDAVNRDEFAALVRHATGFELEILSGEAEATWTYRGAISGIPDLERATVVDIGGGSTEITVGNQRDISHSISLDIGSVRLSERVFKHDPPTPSELEQAIDQVENELARAATFNMNGSTLVGVAGTATTLAVLAQGLRKFDVNAVRGYRLSRHDAGALFGKLSTLTSIEILSLSTALEGRNDVITAGALILREVMEHFKFDQMIVSERGVRYGLVLREREILLKNLPPVGKLC